MSLVICWHALTRTCLA